jgi:hypothetical protein
MPKRILIDAHQDLTYNMLTFGRDYRLSAAETRQREAGTETPSATGIPCLGWPEYQHGQVAASSLLPCLSCRSAMLWLWEKLTYRDLIASRYLLRQQFDLYHRLTANIPISFAWSLQRKI